MNTNIIEVRNKVSNSILTRLGGNEMDIELDPTTVQKCIDLALAKYLVDCKKLNISFNPLTRFVE